MFSFRRDKVGFFFGLALIVICLGTFIATLVLLIVGAALGEVLRFLFPIRLVLAGWWFACIVTVLSRVYILNYQMKQRREVPPGQPPSAEPGIAFSVAPSTPEAEVARARADAERYRAIGAIGVATVLGVASALAIISFLAVGVPDRPGAMPVQIVAWSVGGGVIIVVVLLCVIALRRREPRWPFPKQEPASTGIEKQKSQAAGRESGA